MPEQRTGKAVYFIVHICFTGLSSPSPLLLWCKIEGSPLAYKTVWGGNFNSGFDVWVSLLVFLSLVALKRLITTMLEYMNASSIQILRLIHPLKLKVREFDVAAAVFFMFVFITHNYALSVSSPTCSGLQTL